MGLWTNFIEMAPNGAGSFLFPTHPDLANILGKTDLYFENFHFWDFSPNSVYTDGVLTVR